MARNEIMGCSILMVNGGANKDGTRVKRIEELSSHGLVIFIS